MFERFTGGARRVLVLAQEEARLLGHPVITPGHLLLGLLGEAGDGARVLAGFGVDVDVVRGTIATWALPTEVLSPSPPFTPEAKQMLEGALRESLSLGHRYIGTEHLVLGLIAQEQSRVGPRILSTLGVDLEQAREAVAASVRGAGGQRVPYPSWTRQPAHPQEARIVACSFCGREPPQSGRLIAGTDAFICEHCVRQWWAQLGRPGGPPSTEPFVPLRVSAFYPLDVQPTGPPPDDEDAARAAIATAFSEHGTLSDDRRSLPMVERGEGLGPTLVAASEGRGRFISESAEIEVTVDLVRFVDAEHAAVWFTITIDGRALLRRHRGDAVLVEGVWKMARSTFCNLMSLAGVPCPPEAEGSGGW